VFEWADARCQRCGAEATGVDHIAGPIDGDINHPDNLQAFAAAAIGARP
jgi:hypothetical protein